MKLSVGLIGLPNAGKSTLFNALLQKQQAFVAAHPFTTIAPNVGIVPVSDPRLDQISQIIGSAKKVPATIKFVDIAGLVKGAHQGEGLANQFLAHIREVDLICHVIRSFHDANVTHITGEINPENDRQIVETELIMADLEWLKAQSSKLLPAQAGKTQNDSEKVKGQLIKKIISILNTGKLAKDISLTDQEKHEIRDLDLLTIKPVIYIINVDEKEYASLPACVGRGSSSLPQNDQIKISAKIEAEIGELPEAEQKIFLEELGLKQSGLERLIKLVYQKLGLISFFSGNAKETHAWTLRRGDTALRASSLVHSDFAKQFIKAEVINWQEFVRLQGWKQARARGLTRFEGRDYLIQDGDVVDFKIGG